MPEFLTDLAVWSKIVYYHHHMPKHLALLEFLNFH